MDHTWPEHILTECSLGSGTERFPNVQVRVFAPDARATAYTTHLCYLARITGNGRKFVVGPKWKAMVERHADEIDRRVD